MELVELFRETASENRDAIVRQLNVDDVVSRDASTDILVDMQFTSEKNKLFTGLVHRTIDAGAEATRQFYEANSGLVAFSEVLEKGVGHCLEKSMYLQLLSQGQNDMYLLAKGLMDNGKGYAPHAANVLVTRSGLRLIDVEWGAVNEEDKFRPLYATITDISDNGTLTLNQDTKSSYKLF